MIQAYSSNIDIAANEAVVFNNVSIKKGCTAVLSGPSTISLNQRGLYMVEVDGYGNAGAAGDVSFQLYRDGAAVPQAISIGTAAAADDTIPLSFTTLVQVTANNSNCCYSSPTTIQVLNGDVALTAAHCNIVVTKVC